MIGRMMVVVNGQGVQPGEVVLPPAELFTRNVIL